MSPCLPHLSHWDAHPYQRGLGICGPQGHAVQSLPGLHGSGWGWGPTRNPDLLPPTTLGTRTPGWLWTVADLIDTLTSPSIKHCHLCSHLCPRGGSRLLSLALCSFLSGSLFPLGLVIPSPPPSPAPFPGLCPLSSGFVAPSLCLPVPLSLLICPTFPSLVMALLSESAMCSWQPV